MAFVGGLSRLSGSRAQTRRLAFCSCAAETPNGAVSRRDLLRFVVIGSLPLALSAPDQCRAEDFVESESGLRYADGELLQR